jgi:vitamin B12 transporter
MNKVLSLALACLLLQTGQVLSAEISTLEPVIVTATRFAQPASQIPASTTVISADQIAASGARDLGEVLRDVVSLDVSSNGPRGATAFGKIRGSSAEQVLVLLDGVRLNSEQNGTFDLNSLPVTLKDIERIEIVRGPASALYGSAASGGVIQIITRKAESKPLTIANWNEGSHDTRNFGLSQSWKPGRFYYRIGASGDRSDGYRDNSELNQETYNGLIGIDLPGGYNVEASAYYLDKKNGVPGSTFWPLPNAKQRDKNTFSQLKLSGPAGPLEVTARLIYDRQKNQYEDPDNFPPEDDTHILETLGTEVQATWKAGIHTLVFGGDFYDDELDSTANGDQEQERWSLFTQYEIEPVSWARILAGLRYDEHSDFRSVFSPRAGLVLLPTDSTTIRLSAGKSFRAPTFNDRFWPDLIYVKGNPDLDPETAWEYEVGLEQNMGQWGVVNVAGFMRQAKDLIVWKGFPMVPPLWPGAEYYMPVNYDKVRTWGAEADATFHLHEQLQWGLNYTFLRPKDRNTGDYIPNIPHHQAGSFIEIGPFWDIKLRLAGRYVRYYKDPSRRHPSYMVFDATLSRPFVIGKGLELELMVAARNIFDKEYEINNGYPMPPAEIQVGITAYF